MIDNEGDSSDIAVSDLSGHIAITVTCWFKLYLIAPIQQYNIFKDPIESLVLSLKSSSGKKCIDIQTVCEYVSNSGGKII